MYIFNRTAIVLFCNEIKFRGNSVFKMEEIFYKYLPKEEIEFFYENKLNLIEGSTLHRYYQLYISKQTVIVFPLGYIPSSNVVYNVSLCTFLHCTVLVIINYLCKII